MVDYFKKGFLLVLANPWIYFINLALYILAVLIPQLTKLFFFSLIMLILTQSFWLYLPFFFSLNQSTGQKSFKKIMAMWWESMRRIILPIIGLLFIGIIFVFIIVLLLVMISPQFFDSLRNIGEFQFINFIRQPLSWFAFSFVIAWLFSLLIFSPIFFSLEKNKLIKSLLKSIAFSFHHAKFFLTLTAIVFLTSLLSMFFYYSPLFDNIGQISLKIILVSPINQLIYLSLFAAALIYYQEKTLAK